jgi:glycolate oxidase iron-sulfur subunit
MQTRLIAALRETSDGQEADRILRNCVHCGFCTATCPTYQLLGDELDGPRGRIYQIKMVLEGETATRTTQQHLDRCLTCLNCETTCPSGVEYHKLVEIGRERVEQVVRRPLRERLMRWGLRKVVPYPRRFRPLLRLAQAMRPLVPPPLRAKVPVALSKPDPAGACAKRSQRWLRGHDRGGALSAGAKRVRSFFHGNAFQPRVRGPRRNPDWDPDWNQERKQGRYVRRVLMLDNCVEPALTPATVDATLRVLGALGIEALQPAGGGCCGAISQHLAAPDEAKGFMRRNIDAWWPLIAPEDGAPAAEAILVTASGCGAVVKEYGWLLRDDPEYAAKAARVSALACDLSELLSAEDLARLPSPGERGLPQRIAFHPPCTLQHGQGLMGRVETLLRAAGFELTPVRDAHSCCGSAGTYSILQAGLAERLRSDRLAALQAGEPALIATANVGCQTHLAAAAGVPVRHWIELFDPDGALAPAAAWDRE